MTRFTSEPERRWRAASCIVQLALAGALSAGRAHAEEPVPIERVEIIGNRRTRQDTVLELLPRPPPAFYSKDEIEELERRLNNLEIFDEVRVKRQGPRLVVVDVREKWTLIPTVEFSTGKTIADARLLVGATEYNVLGTANQLTLNLFREERGFGANIAYSEHVFRRRRWALEAELFGASSAYRFETGSSWNAWRSGAEIGFTSPPFLSKHLNVRAGSIYYFEAARERVMTNVPSDAHAVGMVLDLLYNRYEFHDLVSSGVKARLGTDTGLLAGTTPAQPRHRVDLRVVGALPLARTTVLMARVVAGAATRGNANFSALIGSIDGVRGLEDTLYRSWLQAVANLELRHAIPIVPRWALQGVLFGDGAVFERITEDGGRGDRLTALSVGGGLRVVPTWLTNVVVRADLAFLLAPASRPFLQLGLKQYF